MLLCHKPSELIQRFPSIDKEHLPKLMLWTFSCYPPSAYSHDLGKAHGMCCPAERWSYGIHPPTLW